MKDINTIYDKFLNDQLRIHDLQIQKLLIVGMNKVGFDVNEYNLIEFLKNSKCRIEQKGNEKTYYINDIMCLYEITKTEFDFENNKAEVITKYYNDF